MEQITLDLIPNGVMPNIHASQFDHGRTIRFNLCESKTPFSLLATDYVKVTCNNIESVSSANVGNSHDWTIPDSVVADSGIFIGELTIERDSVVVGSKNFVLNVEEDAYNGKNIEERTASGIIANFETNLQDNLTACKCEINALQSGTGTPSPNNPRPISGFNGATIVRCGVNLVKKQALMQFCPMASGTRIYAQLFDTAAAFSLYIVKKGLDPTVTANWTSFLSLSTTKVNNILPFDISHIGISNSAYSSLGTGNIMVSLSDITEFKPYIGEAFAVSFGQTVYGGVLDVTNGKLRVTEVCADLGDLTWSYNSSLGIFYTSSLSATINKANNQNLLSDIYQITSLPISASNTDWQNESDFTIGKRGDSLTMYIYCLNSNYTDAPTFNTAMSGHQLVYELATPTEITLTAKEIEALLGTNNVYHDCNGETEVKYLVEV